MRGGFEMPAESIYLCLIQSAVIQFVGFRRARQRWRLWPHGCSPLLGQSDRIYRDGARRFFHDHSHGEGSVSFEMPPPCHDNEINVLFRCEAHDRPSDFIGAEDRPQLEIAWRLRHRPDTIEKLGLPRRPFVLRLIHVAGRSQNASVLGGTGGGCRHMENRHFSARVVAQIADRADRNRARSRAVVRSQQLPEGPGMLTAPSRYENDRAGRMQ